MWKTKESLTLFTILRIVSLLSVNDSLQFAEWPKFPDDFSFGPKVRASAGEICVRIFERRDYFTWRNYLFCTPGDKRQLEMRWSDEGPLRDRECTRIYVPADSRGSRRTRWGNNYLCVPKNSGIPYKWDIKSIWFSFEIHNFSFFFIIVVNYQIFHLKASKIGQKGIQCTSLNYFVPVLWRKKLDSPSTVIIFLCLRNLFVCFLWI